MPKRKPPATVRDYEPRDDLAMRGLMFEIARNVYGVGGSDLVLREAVKMQMARTRWILFMAEAEGAVVGFSSASPGGVSVYVRPEWRGKGIGRALVTRAADHLRATGATSFRMHATSEDHHRLIRRLGGSPVREHAVQMPASVTIQRDHVTEYEVPLGERWD